MASTLLVCLILSRSLCYLILHISSPFLFSLFVFLLPESICPSAMLEIRFFPVLVYLPQFRGEKVSKVKKPSILISTIATLPLIHPFLCPLFTPSLSSFQFPPILSFTPHTMCKTTVFFSSFLSHTFKGKVTGSGPRFPPTHARTPIPSLDASIEPRKKPADSAANILGSGLGLAFVLHACTMFLLQASPCRVVSTRLQWLNVDYMSLFCLFFQVCFSRRLAR